MRSAVRLGLATAVGVAALVWVFRATPPRDVLAALGHVRPLPLLAAAMSVVLTVGAVAARWRLLLTPGPVAPWHVAFEAVVIGQAVNILLPIRLGEVARGLRLQRTDPVALPRLVASFVLERVFDVVALAVAVAVILVAAPLPAGWTGPARMLVIAGLITVVLLAVVARGRWPDWAADAVRARAPRWGGIAGTVVDALAPLRSMSRVTRAGAWSLAIVAGAVGTNYLLFLAFDLNLSITTALALLFVLEAGTAVVSVPGNLGVFHALVVATLAASGVARDQAIGYAVVLHAVAILPKVAGGLAYLATGDRWLAQSLMAGMPDASPARANQ